jgi:hypothetical protein
MAVSTSRFCRLMTPCLEARSSSVQDLLGQQGAVVELEAKHDPVQQSKGIPAMHQVVGVEAGVVLVTCNKP